MKPAFALDFRDDTIRLLHRSGGGWQLVGQVSPGDPDLAEAMGYLRATALGLSPRGIATKLILPNAQILYTDVTVAATEARKRRKEIAAALEGRTPYSIDELAFDSAGKGSDVQVAVVARETLAEAEAFAAEHRFNPVSFVAAPDAGQFDGEPWFGATALAAEILAEGEKVERDNQPVQLMQRGLAAEPQPAPPPPEVPEPQPDPAPLPEPAPAPEPLPAPAPPEEPQTPADLPADDPALPPEIPAAPEPAPEPPAPVEIPPDVPEPDVPDGPAPEIPFDPLPELAASAGAATPSAGDDRLARLRQTLSVPITQPPRKEVPPDRPMKGAAVDTEEAPIALDVPEEAEAAALPPRLDPVAARVTDPVIDDELPPVPADSARLAFASRRQPGDPPSPGLQGQARPLPGAAASKAPMARPAALPPAGARAAAKPAKALRGLGAMVTAPGIAGERPRVKVAATQTGAQTDAQTSPGQGAAADTPARPARQQPGFGLKPAPVRGKPRYLGLILTVVLLFLLAMVAAWSSYSLAFWQGKDVPAAEATETVQADPSPADADADDAAAPEVSDEMLADMQDPAELGASVPQSSATGSSGTAGAEPAAPALTGVASTTGAGSVAQARPSNDAQNEIYLATADAPPQSPDPLALPDADARGDPLPAVQAAPPPFGTVYQFDADGRIRPTPEGVITPEGVLLVAGKPPRVPAERPAGLATVAPAPADLAAEAAAIAPAAIVNDPALAGKKPAPRPAGIAPAAAPDIPADQGTLAPAADSRFADLRPKARPAAVLAAGEAARAASAAASLVAQAEASPLAVSISRRPAARPEAIARAAAAAALAAAAAEPAPAPAPEPEPEPAKAAAAPEPEPQAEPDKPTAPEDDGEPDLAAAAGKTPTKATVAKQATFKNAINLSAINLIGVYGTPSSRYALVRMGNGNFKKVKVGDRIDGGKVAAITDKEVRYQKGGKLITLAMPKG